MTAHLSGLKYQSLWLVPWAGKVNLYLLLVLQYWLAKWAGWVYIVGFVPKRKKSLFNLNKSFFDHFKYVQTRCVDFCIICSFSQREVEKSLSHLLDRSMKTVSAVWQSISNSSVSVRSLVVSVRGVSQLWLILKYHWWISYYCDTIFLCQACPLFNVVFSRAAPTTRWFIGLQFEKKGKVIHNQEER